MICLQPEPRFWQNEPNPGDSSFRLSQPLEAAMARNILIFSDGTGQVGGYAFDEDRTNVYKLFRATRACVRIRVSIPRSRSLSMIRAWALAAKEVHQRVDGDQLPPTSIQRPIFLGAPTICTVRPATGPAAVPTSLQPWPRRSTQF